MVFYHIPHITSMSVRNKIIVEKACYRKFLCCRLYHRGRTLFTNIDYNCANYDSFSGKLRTKGKKADTVFLYAMNRVSFIKTKYLTAQDHGGTGGGTRKQVSVFHARISFPVP